jgi:hypothetical protein
MLEVLGFENAIPHWKGRALLGKEEDAKKAVFAFFEGRAKRIDGLEIDEKKARGVVRQWKLQDEDQQRLLRDVLPRFDLRPDQIRRVLSPERVANGNGGIF